MTWEMPLEYQSLSPFYIWGIWIICDETSSGTRRILNFSIFIQLSFPRHVFSGASCWKIMDRLNIFLVRMGLFFLLRNWMTFRFFLLSSMYSQSKKKRNTPIYFNTNYRTEMKLVPIIMDYCLLHLDAFKFFLGVRLHGEYQLIFNLFNINPQFFLTKS